MRQENVTRRRMITEKCYSIDKGMSTRHIALVGVAAVGKTTLSEKVAWELSCPFADVDLVTESETGKSIETLLAEGGDSGLNDLLWEAYEKMLRAPNRTIIVVSPRLLNRPSFWAITRRYAITVHIRSTPLKILRRELASERAVSENEVVITEDMKARYYDYYWWRLRHCQKVEHEIRVSGCLDKDVAELVPFLQAIWSTLQGWTAAYRRSAEDKQAGKYL